MTRPNTAATRNLTLTEELERLEQSITLTLQEIDHNFSRAHRIVTSSILPIVDQYAKHSEAVWEGSKFWKQFFEASANVSLEGYDDAHVEDSTVAPEETEYEVTETTQTFASEALEDGDATITDKLDEVNSDNEDILSSPSMAHAHSTPRVPSTIKGKHKSKALPPQPIFADYPSPYEAMRREMEGQSSAGTANPTTPGKGHALPDMSMTPQSSPFMVEKDDVLDASERNKDTILHQGILNRTYRVAATPHRGAKKQATTTLGGKTPGTANRTRSRWLDETMSSPDEPTPQLRAELFSSPVRQPRTPGASVVTPSLKQKLAKAAWERDEKRDNAVGGIGDTQESNRRFRDEPTSNFTRTMRAQWESDDEDDDFLDMSPPKTIQFDLPKRPLLQTPAREASRRIMDDLLLTAGADISEEMEGEESPSIVTMNDETF